jgi:hypothetical protein
VVVIFHTITVRFDRGVVHVLLAILSIITLLDLTEKWFMFWLLYCLPLLSKVWQRGGTCCGNNNMDYSSVKPQTIMVDNITSTTWTSSVKPYSNGIKYNDWIIRVTHRSVISWEAFLEPSDSYFPFADLVGFYPHWTYMHIFLNN